MEESIFNFVWIYLDMFEKLMRKKRGFKCCKDILEFCIYVISMDNEYLEKKMYVYKINAILRIFYIMLRIIGIIVYRFQKENSYPQKAIILLNIKCNSFTFDL